MSQKKKRIRYCISISRATYARLEDHKLRTGERVGTCVERLLRGALDAVDTVRALGIGPHSFVGVGEDGDTCGVCGESETTHAHPVLP